MKISLETRGWISRPVKNDNRKGPTGKINTYASTTLMNEASTESKLANLVKLQALVRGHQVRGKYIEGANPNKTKPQTDESLEEDMKRLDSKGCLFKMDLNDPLQYLAPVRLNKQIRDDLIALEKSPSGLSLVKQTSEAIKSGDWSAELFDINRHLGDGEKSLNLKDILFYAYWSGSITESEFNQGLHMIDLQEQFVDDEDYVKLAVVPLFDGDGVLTEGGSEYVDSVLKNFNQRSETDLSKSALMRQLKTGPINLRFITRLEFSRNYAAANTHSAPNPSRLERAVLWSQGLRSQGYYSVGSDRSEGGWRNIQSFKAEFPSYGMLTSMNKTLTPHGSNREVALPKRQLGVIGTKTLAYMHHKGFHPVASVDNRIKKGIDKQNIHGFEYVGAALLAEHDTAFHTAYASRLSTSEIRVATQEIPNIVEHFIKENTDISEQELKHLNIIAEEAIDLGYDPGNMSSRLYKMAIGLTSVKKLVSFTECVKTVFKDLDQQQYLHHARSFLEASDKAQREPGVKDDLDKFRLTLYEASLDDVLIKDLGVKELNSSLKLSLERKNLLYRNIMGLSHDERKSVLENIIILNNFCIDKRFPYSGIQLENILPESPSGETPKRLRCLANACKVLDSRLHTEGSSSTYRDVDNRPGQGLGTRANLVIYHLCEIKDFDSFDTVLDLFFDSTLENKESHDVFAFREWIVEYIRAEKQP